ncbi:unnamed protein product [Urochloa humidicola]
MMVPTKKMQLFVMYQDKQTTFTIKVFQGQRSMTKTINLLGSLIPLESPQYQGASLSSRSPSRLIYFGIGELE